MAFSFANFCPHCWVASEIFVNEQTLPEGSVQLHYQCPRCKGSVACSSSYFISILAVPSDGTVANLGTTCPNVLKETESMTPLNRLENFLPSRTAEKTMGRLSSVTTRRLSPHNGSMEAMEEVGTFGGHRGPVRIVTFSSDRNIVVSGGQEGGIRLRRLNNEISADLVIPKTHPGGVHLLALSPDNKMLVSVAAGNEGTAYLWDLTDAGARLRALLRLPQGSAESLAFSPSADLLAIGSRSSILLWNLNRLGHREDYQLQGHPQAVRSLSFAPSGQLLASGHQDGTVCLWTTDLDSPRRIAVVGNSKDQVLSVAFAADGQELASGGNDRLVHLWEYSGDQLRHQSLEGHEAPVRLVLFPPDGRTLLSVDTSHRVYLWDLASRTKIRQWLLPGGDTIVSVASTCDGRYLAAGKVGFVTVLRPLAKSKELVDLAV